MKDLDFDELDRAVSSLLGANGDAEPKRADALPSSERSETLVAATPTAVSVTTSSPDVPTTTKKQLVERRPSGRFMDVMHASSDMKNRQKPAVSRQAAMVTPPVQPSADESPVPSAPPVSENDAMVEVNEVSEVDKHTLPDPLDFHNFSMEDTESLDKTDTPAEVDETDDHTLALEKVASELDEIDDIIAKDQEPVSVDTPFIDGSTIEKRPLGAFSVDTADTDGSLLAVPEAPVETVDDEILATEQVPSAETESETKHDEEGDDLLVEREAQTPVDVDIVPEELKGDIVAVESTPVDTAAQPALAGGSIQQQYTEKIQSPTDEPTPVFDTTQYHQPLKHTPKQKSGWTGVVLIILFIVAGVGAGAAVYFFDPFGLM